MPIPVPGVYVQTSELAPPSGISTSTGTAFVAGNSDAGSGITPVLCHSINDYITGFGPRSTTSATLYDWCDDFFHEGGSRAYVLRVTDNTAVAATLTLSDTVPHPTVLVTAQSAGTAGNNYFIAVAIAASKYTVTVQDSAGDVLETHGPYLVSAGNAPLLADATSTLVNFTQSAGSGFTSAAPNTLTPTALAGGSDANDLTSASAVATLANFPASLGPGTVALAGYKDQTSWTGLLAHAANNNRFAALDISDSATAATLVSAIGTTGTTATASYGMFTASSVIIPGITPGTSRTVPGSASVAGLRAQVAATGNDNTAPAGETWPLNYASGFTNTFGTADTTTLNAAGINTFAVRFTTLCLFGFVTPVSSAVDSIFWQATATAERMALVADAQQLAEPFLFDTIDGRGLTLTALQGVLQGLIQQHWNSGALFGATAADAGTVTITAPINTAATAAAGVLGAQMQVLISPFAQQVLIGIELVPITVGV